MKILLSAILLILALPSAGLCESCDALAKQLVRLRGEYHGYATADEAQKKLTTFDDLTGKLDEIIEVKKKMRQADCKIPPRSKALDMVKYPNAPADRAKKNKKRRSRRHHR